MSTSGLTVTRASSPCNDRGSSMPGDSAPGTDGPRNVPASTATTASPAPAVSSERLPIDRRSATQCALPS